MSFTGSTVRDRADFETQQVWVAKRQAAIHWEQTHRVEQANQLIRREHTAKSRVFSAEPELLTGFGELS
jgi:hypothetical protein